MTDCVLMPAEATDDIVQAMLCVEWPALYRHGLFTPHDGPNLLKETEKRIAIAKEMYRQAVKVASRLDNGQ